MTKRIQTVLSAIVSLTVFLGVSFAPMSGNAMEEQPPDYSITVFHDGFEDGFSAGDWNYSPTATVDIVDANGSAALQFVRGEVDAKKDLFLRMPYKTDGTSKVYEAYKDNLSLLSHVQLSWKFYRATSTAMSIRLYAAQTESSAVYDQIMQISSSGTITLIDGSSTEQVSKSLMTCPEGEWYQVDAFMNLADKTYDLFVNTVRLTPEEGYKTSKLNNNIVSWGLYISSTAAAVDMMFDDIRILRLESLALTATPENIEGFSVVDPIKLKFNNVLADEDLSEFITLLDDKGQETEFDFETDGAVLKVIPAETLRFDASYTLTLKAGLPDMYGTVLDEDKELTLHTCTERVAYSASVDGDEVRFKIFDPYSEKTEFQCAYAVFDNGVMTEYQCFEPETADANGLYVKQQSDVYGEVYTWITDGAGQILHAVGSDDGKAWKLSDGIAQISDVRITEGMVTVTGSAGVPNAAVLLSIFKGNEPICVKPLHSDEVGSITATYAATGGDSDFSIKIKLLGSKNSDEREVVYIGEETKAVILTGINNAANTAEIARLLTDYQEKINLSDRYLTEDVFGGVFRLKKYDTYEELSKTIIRVREMLDEMIAAEWSELAEMILANEDMLPDGGVALAKFKAMSAVNRNKVCKSVKTAGFNGFDTLMSELAKAVESVTAASSSGSSSGSYGGNGGGGSSSGFSVSSASAPSVPVEVTPSVTKPQVFQDIDGVPWAHEAIESLLQLNIISRGELFRPHADVSREEFVKMLAMLFKLNIDSADSSFADVGQDDWYAPYIVAAAKVGIVQGKEDGSFGVGERITREDMAVMLCRAAEQTGHDFQVGNAVERFADDLQISDYARNSVYSMRASGIIAGTGGGNFEPKSYADRASAAKIMYELCNRMKGDGK